MTKLKELMIRYKWNRREARHFLNLLSKLNKYSSRKKDRIISGCYD